MKLATIGYEMNTQPQLIEKLKDAGVEVVIDVRAVASSRRAGFAKSLLSAGLNEAGIGYVHLRELGTPKPGRIAARAGRVAEMHRIFNDHLAEPSAQVELAKAAEMAKEKKVALLCLEADHDACHRSIVADRICEAIGCEIEKL
ncbi:MAG: DUF488 domain-containing protein [Proteobacteria bacterium]|nr:DUF488 domain-containing protein [Pseudomonadota bacterium]